MDIYTYDEKIRTEIEKENCDDMDFFWTYKNHVDEFGMDAISLDNNPKSNTNTKCKDNDIMDEFLIT